MTEEKMNKINITKEVFTCVCGIQNVWQIGKGYIKCTFCKTEYCLPFDAEEFNNHRSRFISKITKEVAEKYIGNIK